VLEYTTFLTVSSGASAGFMGLLFVGMSVYNRGEADQRLRERRTVLAAGAFMALVNTFFVSTVTLTGGAKELALMSLGMACIGLMTHSRLLRRAVRAGNFAPAFPNRRLNFAFAGAAFGIYTAQAGLGVAALADAGEPRLTHALVLLMPALFGSALGRAWEITGIREGTS